jgi:signal transduction histidine kinase
MTPQDATGHNLGPGLPVVVASIPINASQRSVAIIIAVTLLAVALVEAPFAEFPLARIDAFIPVLQTVICVADLLTSVLLLAQYTVEQRLAILVLASGYIASGLFAFLQTLAFPGAYAPSGIIGDGLDSPAWLFVCWQTTFPAAIFAYALLKDKLPLSRASGRPSTTIVAAVVCTIVLIAGLTFLATAGVDHLPDLYRENVVKQTQFAKNINIFLLLCGATAFVVVLLRRRAALDLWLAVTLFAWMPNFLISAIVTAVRFSAGWYTARIFALIASSMVLIVLLTETVMLYARLATAVTLSRRERANRLMSLDAATAAMAHEIRQPLAAIGARGSAAMRWLDRTPPDIKQVYDCISSMVNSNQRAEQIIANVRALFQKIPEQRVLLHVDEVVQEALQFAQDEIKMGGVSVITNFQYRVALVQANRVQLQQVVLNLIRNSIDAMAHKPLAMRRLRLTTAANERADVLLSVEDSGSGIADENRGHLFDAFYTTKVSGMGLGLAMCQTIIVQHGGVLRLARTSSHGSVFEVTLPVASTTVG